MRPRQHIGKTYRLQVQSLRISITLGLNFHREHPMDCAPYGMMLMSSRNE